MLSVVRFSNKNFAINYGVFQQLSRFENTQAGRQWIIRKDEQQGSKFHVWIQYS